MRNYAVVLAVSALLGSQPVWATDTGSSAANSVAHEQSLINQANEKLTSKDWRGAEALLKQISEDEGFSLLDDEAQQSVLYFLASTAYQNKDDETAMQAIRRACSFAQATADDWNLRFWIAVRRQDDDDMVSSFTTIAEKWPASLADFEDETVHYVVDKAKTLPAGAERRTHILQVLFAAKWSPAKSSADTADFLWIDLVRAYLDRHDLVQARAVAAAITRPEVIVEMRIEKTFDVITTAEPARFDVGDAYSQAVARARARMAAHPELLDAVVDLAEILEKKDKADEALAILDEALARTHRGKPPFTDIDDKLNWAYNARADALLSLNRIDEGIAQYVEAAHSSEYGNTNVSQTINLADMYFTLGRPKEALATLANFKGKASPYGQMAFEEARACSYGQLHDTANLASSMAYLRAHSADAPGVMIDALMCAGDIEGAANAIVSQLNDPDQRSATLLRLQIFADPRHPATKSDFERTMEAGLDALRARADVQAAVAKVGRIEHLPTVLL